MAYKFLTAEDYARSVVAVPPIALTADHHVDPGANAAIMRHILAGGIPVLLYGGNANLYHYGASLYQEAAEVLHDLRPEGSEILFSIGPDAGRAVEQATLLRQMGVQSAMLLPTAFPSSPAGVVAACRQIARALGNPIVLYIKRENYLSGKELAALIADGAVGFVKYAVERADAAQDAYLDELLAENPARLIASGMAETPVTDHVGSRGMATFTSGAVCIAPKLSARILRLLREGDLSGARQLMQPCLAFEKIRQRHGGIATLHDAVALAGIAETGPILPMLANLDAAARQEVAPYVAALRAAEATLS